MNIEKAAKYFDRVGARLDPVSIQCGITDFCFNQCSFCGHHERTDKTMMLPEEWLSFLDKRKMVKSVCYSGGDPMTYLYFNEIMDYHIDNNIPFGVITAGHIPNTINVNTLSKASFVAISLDTLDERVYAATRGRYINVHMVKDGIDKLLALNTRIKLGITITEATLPGLDDLMKYAAERPFQKVFVHPPYNSNLYIPRLSTMSNSHTVIAQYKDLNTDVQCSVPYYHAFIDAHGDIYHCCLTAGDTCSSPQGEPLGNINKWEAYLERREQFVRTFPRLKEGVCSSCQDRLNGINHAVQELNRKHIFF